MHRLSDVSMWLDDFPGDAPPAVTGPLNFLVATASTSTSSPPPPGRRTHVQGPHHVLEHGARIGSNASRGAHI